jgi:hypothetical protein
LNPRAIDKFSGAIGEMPGCGPMSARHPSGTPAMRAAMQFQTRINDLTIGDAEDRRIAFRGATVAKIAKRQAKQAA